MGKRRNKVPQVTVEQQYIPDGKDIHGPMYEELSSAPDRVAGILGGAYLDECLDYLLKKFLIHEPTDGVPSSNVRQALRCRTPP